MLERAKLGWVAEMGRAKPPVCPPLRQVCTSELGMAAKYSEVGGKVQHVYKLLGLLLPTTSRKLRHIPTQLYTSQGGSFTM